MNGQQHGTRAQPLGTRSRFFGIGFALQIFFPENCPVCGTSCTPICPECLERAITATPLPGCLVCGGASPCARHGRRYERRSLVAHRNDAREILLAAKYGGSGKLATILGERLAPLIPEADAAWSIVPIPNHPTLDFFPRGDGHLVWMARGLSRVTHAPVRMSLKWKRKLTPQKQQPDYAARHMMPRDSFVCVGAVPEKIILLDDVSTSGTTLLRAAQCLYAGGAREIISLSWSVTVH